jgi:hypothetical protein
VNQAFTIFAAGLGGVFLGMVLLYASIKVTTFVTGRLERSLEGEKKKK